MFLAVDTDISFNCIKEYTSPSQTIMSNFFGKLSLIIYLFI